MTTQCFLRKSAEVTAADQVSLGTNAANLAGTASGWAAPLPIRTTRGGGVVASAATATAAGTTLGVEMSDGVNLMQWISPPLDAAVTISGTVTFNVWMSESATTANTGSQVMVERINASGAIASTVSNSEKGIELTTSRAAQNWTATPTSTAFSKGDRIRIRVAGNDAGGTMSSGKTFNLGYAGTSAAADGDSYVTFNETFGFLTTDPTTTTMYQTNTSSDAASGADLIRKVTALTRGVGVVSLVTNTAAGWTAPIQCTGSAGGSTAGWYTKQLNAFTLAGPVLVNVRGLTSGAVSAALRAEMAVTASDGTGGVVWAATSHPVAQTTSEVAYQFYLAGADTAVTDQQRLRLRLYIDDSSDVAMGTAATATTFYAGTSGGASGDTYLTFGQTLTEYVVGIPSLTMAPLRP